MPFFSKESLETLRQRVDLAELLSSHIDLKKSGAVYKGLCPFHDEKTPSFTIQKGDSHYHCFGCGAHGDAIQFLMNHVKLNFSEAVESLAQRFHVPLEYVESSTEKKGPDKALLKSALDHAMRFYHFMLLHTEEGQEALQYLYDRAITLDFIQSFSIGFAPKTPELFRKYMQEKSIGENTLLEAGLLAESQKGGYRDFFLDRITFPIHNAAGEVIGFSARKYKESTFGGKYVNTPETALFKKSKILFGLNYSRRRIAKERRAIIVEGQIDALRLIYEGFNCTVAGQGTAFGEGHVKELCNLGVNRIYLAMDADIAGQEAAMKIGNLFQQKGVEVFVVRIPQGKDPDAFIKEMGAEAFKELLKQSKDYLTFLVEHLSRQLNMDSPAGKSELVQRIAKQIRTWEDSLMIHESLRKLAHLAQVPESMIGVGQEYLPNIAIKKMDSIGMQSIDPDLVLESDLLRWLLLIGDTKPELVERVRKNIEKDYLKVPSCKKLFALYIDLYLQQKPRDLLSLAIFMNEEAEQSLLFNLLQKKVNIERAEVHILETIQKILERNWMIAREEIKMRIQSGKSSEEEVLELVKQFDLLKRTPPKVNR